MVLRIVVYGGGPQCAVRMDCNKSTKSGNVSCEGDILPFRTCHDAIHSGTGMVRKEAAP